MLLLDVFFAILYGDVEPGQIHPDVLSMSFGIRPTPAFIPWFTFVENYFPALGAMGVSLIASTGDTGAHGGGMYSRTGPLESGGQMIPPYNCSQMETQFPANSP